MTIAMAATFQQITTTTETTIVFCAATICQQIFKSKKLRKQNKKTKKKYQKNEKTSEKAKKKKNTKRKVKRDKHKIIKRNCNITTTILKGKSDDDNVKEE